jgi:three-Cys-motif partner protein
VVVAGSPLIALDHGESPFSKVLLCELDAENAEALRGRTAKHGSRVAIFQGDCNQMIDTVVREIPRYGLNIALLDPFAASALKFDTIEKLASFTRMDLIIHFPTMDLKRNLGRNDDSVAGFIGGAAGQAQVTSPSDVTRHIDTLRTNLAQHGYTADQVRSMPVKNTKNNVLYHLVFVSKHSKGNAIWQSITKRDSRGQGSLF